MMNDRIGDFLDTVPGLVSLKVVQSDINLIRELIYHSTDPQSKSGSDY